MSQNLDWDALRTRFRTRLHLRMTEIDALMEKMARGDDDEQTALTALQLQFHSLAGIGGTYGYHDITELARLAESVCAATPLHLNEVQRITGEILCAATPPS